MAASWQTIPKWTKVRGAGERSLYRDPTLADSQVVYHYTKLEHLCSAISSRRLWMRNVTEWEDPYEGMGCDAIFGASNAAVNLKLQVFGLCWTTSYQDAAFWRFQVDRCSHRDSEGKPYPAPLPAVRLKTTVGKLQRALSVAQETLSGTAFVGRVRYCPRDQMDAELSVLHAASRSKVASVAANALLMKRRAYSNEREKRVLWIEKDVNCNHREVPCDLLEMMDQVMIGPSKWPAHELEVRRQLEKCGVAAQRIARSTLYDLPTTEQKQARSKEPRQTKV